MRSTLKAAVIFASAGIAAAQQQPAQPPAKERVSVPWYQGSPHRATAVRAGEPAPKQTVYTSINGRPVSGGAEGAKQPVVRFGSRVAPTGTPTTAEADAKAANATNVTISRDADWDQDGDTPPAELEFHAPASPNRDAKAPEGVAMSPAVIKQEPASPRENSSPDRAVAGPRPSLVSHDAYVRTKSPSGIVVSHDGAGYGDAATATKTPARYETGFNHLRAQPVAMPRAEQSSAVSEKKTN